jgi:hypothetical protein
MQGPDATANPTAIPQRPPTARRSRWRSFFRMKPREAITHLLLLVTCFFWIYPFLWMVSAGFKTEREIYGGLSLIPEALRWENFERAWTVANMDRYFVNTTIITVGSIAIVLVSVSLMGYVLGRYQFPGKKIVITIFALTIFLPEGYTIIPIVELLQPAISPSYPGNSRKPRSSTAPGSSGSFGKSCSRSPSRWSRPRSSSSSWRAGTPSCSRWC